MATTPGLLTDWPWKQLGSFKYIILAPWGMQSIHAVATRGTNQIIDFSNLLIIPFLLWRALHNQIWISVSRHRTAKGENRIIDRSIDFDQVDRESNWDDQILLSGIVLYLLNTKLGASNLPTWRSDGIIITMLLHAGPVEYLYYWLHRALHHHYLYSRYHSHHHSSIVSEPITSVAHPFAELVLYFVLFMIPMVGTILSGTASLASLFGYITYIDVMNNMGHCNFEFVPIWLFSVFPPLKYLMYTPSFHSLHHTQLRTNYSLFMPFYDYIYGTIDTNSDELHEASLKKKEDFPDVVHLTHLTTLDSVLHLRIGFASFATQPRNSKFWYLSPLTLSAMVLNLVLGDTFVVETNFYKKLKLQSWVIPRYGIQYSPKFQNKAINGLIEDALLEAEARGAKVLSLGLLNQDEELNRRGEVYIEKHPKLNIKVVDGSSLAVAIVLNSIPKGTTEVLFRGSLSKLSYTIVSVLCKKDIQVATFYETEMLKLSALNQGKVLRSKGYAEKVWIVGDGVTKEEQLKAPKGTLFIPFSQFPPKKLHEKDYAYCHTPSMVAPPSLQNLHSCENWLPRRVMSAWRVAGILHALEGYNVHECGDTMFDVNTIWEAALKHGFRPLDVPK